ncbi:hypothetical protein ACFWOY_13325 [Streptomyces sp. NPDC058423]|uniref:hypothetical protein n=1 Tax=unclassified Streptomyces TaxID=2593676 RepID=UPI003666F406
MRTDYSPCEDDNATVQGVSGSKGGMGCFVLSYHEENKDKLEILKIDGGEGCKEPTRATVQDAAPSRPLFNYPKASSLERDEWRRSSSPTWSATTRSPRGPRRPAQQPPGGRAVEGLREREDAAD